MTKFAEYYPFQWLYNLSRFPIFDWEEKSARVTDICPLLCMLCCEGVIRYPLNLTAYISAWCVYVLCVGRAGRGVEFKKNVIRELKTSIQAFVPTVMTKKSRTKELIT